MTRRVGALVAMAVVAVGVVAAWIAFGPAWWDGSTPAAPEAPVAPVWTTTGALADLASRAARPGILVRVAVAGAGGVPDRAALVEMQRARKVIGLGPVAGETWMGLVGVPSQARVELASGPLGERMVERAGGITHQHGPAGAHTHRAREAAPWLDPRLAREILTAVHAELAGCGLADAQLPPDAAALAGALERAEARLAALPGRALLATAGAYRHLARGPEWALTVVAADPADPAAVAGVAAAAAGAPEARVLLVPRAPHPSWAAELARLRIRVVVVPLDGDGRYFDALLAALDELAGVFE